MRRALVIITAIVLTVSFGAYALTGTGDSNVGLIETVPPTLDKVSATNEHSLTATFSETMLAPGATSTENYAVSGLGAGSLAATPSEATGSDPYILNWTAFTLCPMRRGYDCPTTSEASRREQTRS
jgi:hypothetical protein